MYSTQQFNRIAPSLAGSAIKKFPQNIVLDVHVFVVFKAFLYLPHNPHFEHSVKIHDEEMLAKLAKWIQNVAEKNTRDNAGPRVIIK